MAVSGPSANVRNGSEAGIGSYDDGQAKGARRILRHCLMSLMGLPTEHAEVIR